MSQHDLAATCRNCEAALTGPYCAVCGQKAEHLHKPFWEIAEDFLHSIVHFDGRLWRTLKSLFLRPGEMTADWADGRQARYVPPIRLYVFTSLLLVIVLSISDVVLLRPYSGPAIPGKGAVFEAAGQRVDFEFLNIASEAQPSAKIIDEKKIADKIDDDPATDTAEAIIAKVAAGLNALARNPHMANELISKSLSRFILLAVPAMSLVLWLLYLRQKRYLAEHLVFALHVHTFFFISLLLVVCLVWISRGLVHGGWLFGMLWAAYSLHFLFALKRAYGQGWVKTLLKSALVTGAYVAGLSAIGMYLVVRTLMA